MNIFLKNKFGEDFKDVILNQKNYNTYPYIYVTKDIHKEDIFAIIAIRIFMWLHKYPSIDNYWKNRSQYKCLIPEIMSKTYYYLLAFSLHFEEKANQEIENIDNKN